MTCSDHAAPRGGLRQLKAGEAGKASAHVVGKGATLRLPGLPLAVPLRVQLQRNGGPFWEAVYSSAAVLKDDPTEFLGRAIDSFPVGGEAPRGRSAGGSHI